MTTPIYVLGGAARRRGGGSGTPVDPFWNDVALVTEFNVPQDKSANGRALGLHGYIFEDATARSGSAIRAFAPGNTAINGAMIVDDTTLELGDSNFTIEMFFRSAVEPDFGATLIAKDGSAANRSYWLYWDSTNNKWTFIWYVASIGYECSFNHATNFDGSNDGVTMAEAFDGNYHHLAVVRNGTSIKLYVDGFEGGGVTADDPIGASDVIDASTRPITIAARSSSDTANLGQSFEGQIDDLRFTLGVARYTGPFTPPAGPYPTGGSDANWANVELLIDFNDSPFANWAAGNQAGATAFRSNWTGSIRNPTVADKGLFVTDNNIYFACEAGDSNSWVTAGDFTLEVFGVEPLVTMAAFKVIAGNYHASTGRRGFCMAIGDASTEWSFAYSTNGTAVSHVYSGQNLANNTAYDLCIERTGTTVRLYQDGVMVASATVTDTIFDPIATNPMFAVGAGTYLLFGTNSNGFEDGYIKGVRYTKAARYSNDAGYTVPTLPLPLS